MDHAVVLPGDKLSIDASSAVIGPGLHCEQHGKGPVYASNCGIVRRRRKDGDDPAAVWLDCDNKRYIPVIGDRVVGQVMQKMGAEGWKVDIGCADLANLSCLSFEGATKRNRPDVKIGDLVYGRVTETIEPEIVCVCDDNRARGFGVLSGGWLIRSAPSHGRKLLSSECQLFKLISGMKVPFEVTCGMNGWIWVKGKGARETIHVAKAIEGSRYLAKDQMKDMVSRLATDLRTQFVG